MGHPSPRGPEAEATLSKQQPYTEPRHLPEGCCWDKAWLALETGMESQELSSHMRTAAQARHCVQGVGQLLEAPLFACCLLEAFVLGRGGKPGCQPRSRGCTSLQGTPKQPSSRPVLIASTNKHPKLVGSPPCLELICRADKQKQLIEAMFFPFFSPRNWIAVF